MQVLEVESFLHSSMGKLVQLRKAIHAHPELSHKEDVTARTLISFFNGLKNPPEIVSGVGGTGFLAIFDFSTGADKGYSSQKTVIFRSELDAVPVEEKNVFPHVSEHVGVSHKCGHDGHMAILAGLGLLLSDYFNFEHGRVVLLYQPAEETGEGAQKMIDSNHPVLKEMVESEHTSIFALHNVPGFPIGSIVLPRSSSFASASKGMHIKLKGATSHASQPHLGKNPAMAMCNIIQGLLAMPSLHIPYDMKALVTIVGAKAGEKAFGVSAGDAEVMATLRSTTDKALSILERQAINLVNGISATYGLTATFNWEDPFFATVNNPDMVSKVQESAAICKMNTFWMDEAFPWSEDFGIFLQRIKGAMFGLGMGEDHEPLHGEMYDFTDDQIGKGVAMFASIAEGILGTSGSVGA